MAGSYGGWVQSRKNAKVTQTGNTVLIDHREEVLAHINENVSRAAQAVGMEAVGLIVGQMQSGYGKPIRVTGDLMRDVNFAVEEGEKTTVTVGNSLDYALVVHEGSSRKQGRPYIKDAINNGWGRLQEIWKAYLKG